MSLSSLNLTNNSFTLELNNECKIIKCELLVADVRNGTLAIGHTFIEKKLPRIEDWTDVDEKGDPIFPASRKKYVSLPSEDADPKTFTSEQIVYR